MAQNVEIKTAVPSASVTRAQLIASIESIVAKSGFTDVETVGVSGERLVVKQVIPRWQKFTKGYAQLAAAAASNSLTLMTLPAGGVVHLVKVKHSEQFAGGGISDYKVSVGIAGTTGKYVSGWDVDVATGDGGQTSGPGAPSLEDHANPVDVLLTAASGGANLDAATTGMVDVWVMWSQAV